MTNIHPCNDAQRRWCSGIVRAADACTTCTRSFTTCRGRPLGFASGLLLECEPVRCLGALQSASDIARCLMPRDMTGAGRYAPQPRFPPFAFYSAVRLADPGQLALIMATDPYFVTQDNGAGAPLHFATTYRQLDMVRPLV